MQLELGLFIVKYISLVINCKTQIQIISTQERAFWLCKNDIKKMQIVGVLGTKHMLPRCQQACPWRSQLEASKTCFWQRIFFPIPFCKWSAINMPSIQALFCTCLCVSLNVYVMCVCRCKSFILIIIWEFMIHTTQKAKQILKTLLLEILHSVSEHLNIRDSV